MDLPLNRPKRNLNRSHTSSERIQHKLRQEELPESRNRKPRAGSRPKASHTPPAPSSKPEHPHPHLSKPQRNPDKQL